MATMNTTTTGAGFTLRPAERRSWSVRQLMGRFLARMSGGASRPAAEAAEFPESAAEAGVWRPDHARQVRDAALWSGRPGRLF